MTTTGSILREIILSDPNDVSGVSHLRFVDITGVSSNPSNGDLYVSMLGSSALHFPLLHMNNSGELLNNEYFWYGNDMYFTDEGSLIVGSRTQSPGMFTDTLDFRGSFEGSEQIFVTQISTVPLPAAFWLFGSGLIGLVGLARRKYGRPDCMAVPGW